MKKIIKVSDATYRAIADAAILPFHSTATRGPDGGWLIPIADETWERLQHHQLPGETDDDTIMRVIRRNLGSMPN